jgi:dolichyl-phosphate-mannose-protein mannosyltransferase
VRLADLNRNLRVVVVLALVIAAAWLRFTAVGFGLPQHFRPDEGELAGTALDFDTTWNPHRAIYPAAQMYLLRGVLRADAIVKGESGNLHPIFGPNDQAQAYLISREVSAAMGTATTVAVYLAAAPLCGTTGALASAAVVAFSTLHVRESKFAKVQAPAGLWVALAIAMMMRIVYRGRHSDYALAGLFCGLAGATHYPAGLVAAGVFVAHLEARRRENRALLGALGDGRIYLAGVVTIFTFCCATPYFFLDWAQTVRGYTATRAWGGMREAHGWSWVVKRMMPDSFGITLLIFLLVALVYAILSPRPGVISLLAFIAVTFASFLIGRPALMYRYLVTPLLPMAVLAGVAIGDLRGFASARLGTTRGSLPAVILIGMILAPSLIHDLQLNRLLLQTDTRTLASQWITANIAPGSSVAVNDLHHAAYGRPLLPAGCALVPIQDPAVLRARNVRWVLSDSMPGIAYSPGLSAAQLAALNSGADLVYDINPITDGAAAPIFDPNDAFYAPIQHITSMERPGPRIRIWRIKPA